MRSDHDQWDVAGGVGLTALAVAAGRAVETARPDGLVDDPWARAFVDAVPAMALPVGSHPDPGWADQFAHIGVRSRFFDGFFAAAAAAGIDQAVLLAAGLDTRALRLSWPVGATVYEVDQPGVLEFKAGVLSRAGGPDAGVRVPVPVDLRHDWPAALRGAGFDPARPTAWLAEGLLPYLPAQAERELFERVQELSAPGSRIAIEDFQDTVPQVGALPVFREMHARTGVALPDLCYRGAREEPAAWLARHGWAVGAHTSADKARDYGRSLTPDVERVMGGILLLEATLAAG